MIKRKLKPNTQKQKLPKKTKTTKQNNTPPTHKLKYAKKTPE